ncbi:MAG: hypothetical protein JXA30_16265 [Deltaproteobacteria bacterium]|nr:hypothetical protein [Deltaproteobacteria bacterium]
MRYTIRVITLLFLAVLVEGCTSTERKSAAGSKPGETAASELDRAKSETKEAARAIQDYAYAQKAEFVDKMKRELVEVEQELDRLAFEVDRSNSAAKAEAEKKLGAVRDNWARAKKQLDQAERATESTWDKMKAGFKRSREELKGSFNNTRQWLSDKIEP